MALKSFKGLPLEKRFELSFEKSPLCWVWKKATDRDGYGVLQGANGKQVRAHRVSYQLLVGEFDEKLMVLHRCDNPSCVNPDHLFLGTNMDNVKDKVTKGRCVNPCGEESVLAVLSEKMVKEIRRRYKPRTKRNSGAALAREFGVSPSTVNRIVRGLRWKHSFTKRDSKDWE